ncbi:MAG: alpha/beta fold hydrolase [Candidatus Omnitrophota bacterium]
MLIDGRAEKGGIPGKAGVSSSSALTVASAIVLASANNVSMGPVELAESTCDWERYQTGGGMMDQFASINGRSGHAIFLDCRRVENPDTPEDAFNFKTAPLPKGYKLVAMNTKVESPQVDSEYNERRTCVEVGTRWLRFLFAKEHPGSEEKIRRIRDLTPDKLKMLGKTDEEREKEIQRIMNMLPEEATEGDILNSDYGKSARDGVPEEGFLRGIFAERKTQESTYSIRKRCLYHRAENMRVLAAKDALERGDIEVFAKAINGGQTNDEDGGAQKGLEISCPELDLITSLALQNGAISARLSGKGWGGVAVAIVPPNVDVDKFIRKVSEAYEKGTEKKNPDNTTLPGIQLNRGTNIFVCNTSRGAGIERYHPNVPVGGGESVVLSHNQAAMDIMRKIGTPECPFVPVGVHPDDIEGATTALQRRLMHEGRDNIHWAVLTTGATGILDRQIEDDSAKAQKRESETMAAAGILGIAKDRIQDIITFFRFGAGSREERFNRITANRRQRRFINYLKDIAKGLPEGSPIAVGWHMRYDKHPSHRYGARFVDAAIEKFIEETGRPVYAVRFKLWMGDTGRETPNTYCLMDDREAARKQEILNCHYSQIERRNLQNRPGDNVLTESRDIDSANFAAAQAEFRDEPIANFSRAEKFCVYEIGPPSKIVKEDALMKEAIALAWREAAGTPEMIEAARRSSVANFGINPPDYTFAWRSADNVLSPRENFTVLNSRPRSAAIIANAVIDKAVLIGKLAREVAQSGNLAHSILSRNVEYDDITDTALNVMLAIANDAGIEARLKNVPLMNLMDILRDMRYKGAIPALRLIAADPGQIRLVNQKAQEVIDFIIEKEFNEPIDRVYKIKDEIKDKDKKVAVLGGTGFVGGRFLDNLWRRAGDKVVQVSALSRDPSRLIRPPEGSQAANKLNAIAGDHLSVEGIKNTIDGAEVVIDTAGLAWQHPGARKGGKRELLVEELEQNSMSAALMGALLSHDQRLVWASTNAIDLMLNRLNPENRERLLDEIDSRAYRMRQAASALAFTRFDLINRILMNLFIRFDLWWFGTLEFPKSANDPEAVSYAVEFSYPYSKLLGQRVLEMISKEDLKDIVVVKISDVYGPGQSIGAEALEPGTPARRQQVFTAAHIAVKDGSWGGGNHGFEDAARQNVWNDYVAPTYIDDAVEMLFRASVVTLPDNKVVVEATSPWIPNIEMARAVRDAVGTDVEISTGQDPQNKPSRIDEGTSMLAVERTPLKEGIEAHIKWHRAQVAARAAEALEYWQDRRPDSEIIAVHSAYKNGMDRGLLRSYAAYMIDQAARGNRIAAEFRDEFYNENQTPPVIRCSTVNKKDMKVAFLADMPDERDFPGARPVVFLYHGLSGFKTEPHLQALAEKFASEGCIVVRPDFTNNRREGKPNESDGELKNFSLEDELEDAYAVINYVRDNMRSKSDIARRIFGGHSYGGLIARRIAASMSTTIEREMKPPGFICGVIDMSGIISPVGSVTKVLENQAAANSKEVLKWARKNGLDVKGKGGELDPEKIRSAWEETDSFGPFGGQRFYARGWNEYIAEGDLVRTASATPYVYILGASDDGVRCANLPESQLVNGFIARVSGRSNGMVGHYDMGHTYPRHELPVIVRDIFESMPVYMIQLDANQRALVNGVSTNLKIKNILAGVMLGRIKSKDEAISAIMRHLVDGRSEVDRIALAEAYLTQIRSPIMMAPAASQALSEELIGRPSTSGSASILSAI